MRKIFSACSAATVLLLASCSSEEITGSGDKTVKIPVVPVVEKNISVSNLYVSDIQAVQNVEIRSRISGFLEKIYVDEGQTVHKGQVLFRISDQELHAEVSKAKAMLNSSIAEARTLELEMERTRLLVEKKIISPTELEMARARHKALRAKTDEARSALEHAETRLSYTVIKAPFDGIIDRIPLKTGSLLEEGTLITSVSDISSVYAYFNVSENEYLQYLRSELPEEDNRTARLILSDGYEYELPGKIETVVSEFDETTGSIAFRARFGNPKQLLKHGATGKVRLSGKPEKALLLPQKAAFEIQDKSYVFILDDANNVRMRSFEPAGRSGAFYIVGSGLKKGDRVVFEGIQNIKDGMQITPRLVQVDTLNQSGML